MLSEYQESCELAIWLDRRKVLYTHVPNGGLRNRREAANFKRMGVKAGVPDYLIFTSPNAIEAIDVDGVRRQVRGVAVELKSTAKYAKTSPCQREWGRRLTRSGWIVLVCKGHEDAILRLSRLGYDRDCSI